jgi:hypothetical protein
MDVFPWGVVIILSCGLAFTAYIIYSIMKIAFEEIEDEKPSTHSIGDESGN